MNQGAGRRVLMKKTACKKSHATVPLRWSSTRLTHQTSPRPTFSSSQRWRGSWPVSPSPWRPSRRSGRGLPKLWRRPTSPWPFDAEWSATKNVSTSPGPTLKKAKNKWITIYNRFLLISVFRVLSKHTPYISKVEDMNRDSWGQIYEYSTVEGIQYKWM